MKSRGIDHFDLISGANNDLYWRDKQRIKTSGYEHSVFTSGERIVKKIQDTNLRIERKSEFTSAFLFVDEPVAGERSATEASVRFSQYKTGIFTYDPAQSLYRVGQYGSAHMDAQTNQQLAFRNVLILKIDSYVLKGDTEGRLGMDIVGDGDGMYMVNGTASDIHWSKSSHDQPFALTTQDGKPLGICRGDSYVCIVPLDAKITIE